MKHEFHEVGSKKMSGLVIPNINIVATKYAF